MTCVSRVLMLVAVVVEEVVEYAGGRSFCPERRRPRCSSAVLPLLYALVDHVRALDGRADICGEDRFSFFSSFPACSSPRRPAAGISSPLSCRECAFVTTWKRGCVRSECDRSKMVLKERSPIFGGLGPGGGCRARLGNWNRMLRVHRYQ